MEGMTQENYIDEIKYIVLWPYKMMWNNLVDEKLWTRYTKYSAIKDERLG